MINEADIIKAIKKCLSDKYIKNRELFVYEIPDCDDELGVSATVNDESDSIDFHIRVTNLGHLD